MFPLTTGVPLKYLLNATIIDSLGEPPDISVPADLPVKEREGNFCF